MGCFLPCFGDSKHGKSRKKPGIVPSGDQNLFQRHRTNETLQSIKPIKDRHEEQLDGSIRKKVTFDLNVKTYEEFSAQKIKNCSVEYENEKEKEKEEETQNGSQILSDSSMSSVFSYPPSHRYHNCTSSDDESEVMKSFESDSKDKDGDNHAMANEETSESLFSLSVESRKQVSASEMDEKEVNSPITIRVSPDRELKSIGLNPGNRSKFVDSVLNPVENLTHWKAVKARTSTPSFMDQEKENINLEQEISIPFSEEPSFKSPNRGSEQRFNRPKPELNEIAVDTSLSSWLVESETAPITKNSPNSVGNSTERGNSSRSFEDRTILGALTVEELKHLSATSSPRRSPRRSPEEIPIIGTVGSYWNHTAQAADSDSGSSSRGMANTTSKHREDKRVKWHSTPFETRLERALDRGIAQV